jgi:hypothetical protein
MAKEGILKILSKKAMRTLAKVVSMENQSFGNTSCSGSAHT